MGFAEIRIVLLLFSLVGIVFVRAQQEAYVDHAGSVNVLVEPPVLSSSLDYEDLDALDPNLHEMKYDVGDGEETTMVYIEPDIKTFYPPGSVVPASTKTVPKHNGFSGKFINMSREPLSLYWEDRPGGKRHLMKHHEPFQASGTATFPGHRFVFSTQFKPEEEKILFIVGEYPENIYYYDPYRVEGDPDQTEENLSVLTLEERAKYDGWRKTLLFNQQYRNVTGRSYLANYLRAPPPYFMWRADYFGQQHWITTRETHIVQHPPANELQPIGFHGSNRILRPEQPRMLQAYRDPTQKSLNMTLTVLSVAPRVFEIRNFLSKTEVEHILDLAGGISLSMSSTGEYAVGEKRVDEDSRRTRTSYNSWVKREQSPIIDIVYRRAADLVRIDESLLRFRDRKETTVVPTNSGVNTNYISPISEDLQLVHYEDGQEYTAHHDFGFSPIDDVDQGARYLTLLLYLNEGMTGGETTFPRYVNAETFKELAVTPETGKAVLFYSQLPDGNLDDFSHHSAAPTTEGEKWLINLWVWSPRKRL